MNEQAARSPYVFNRFDWFCVWYPPAWLILFNRHWHHYKPNSDGWNWLEYVLFLIPGGFYLAFVMRWLRMKFRSFFYSKDELNHKFNDDSNNGVIPDPEYQQAFRQEILMPIAKRYFRAELHLNNDRLPASGPLIVALNHAGMCFPWDFLCLSLLLGEQRDWFVQPLAHALFFDHPWLKWWLPNGWAYVLGGVRAETESFEAAIAQKTVMLYAPEGWRGLAKGWHQRYQLANFDSSFVRLSVRYQVPILPVICIGSETLHPFAFNARWIARLFKMPMFPVSPLLPIFAWAVRSRLNYHVQPLWRPWETLSLQPNQTPRLTVLHRLAQELRSRLQLSMDSLIGDRR